MNLFTPILVSGPDARTFLQGQLSCDVNVLTREKPLLAALNSPQGRVQAVLTLTEHDDGIVASVVASMADRTVERLRKYVLRSKVKIEATPSAHPEPVEGFRVPTSAGQDRFDKLSVNGPENLLLSPLRAGIPHVFAETHEAFVAQMLNLDVLGAISFNKGCYTGQEIVARTHYRGAIKRRMFRFAAQCAPPTPATRVLSSGEHAGDVVYAASIDDGCELLAVINLSQADAALTLANGAALTKLTLPYTIS